MYEGAYMWRHGVSSTLVATHGSRPLLGLTSVAQAQLSSMRWSWGWIPAGYWPTAKPTSSVLPSEETATK